MKYSEITIGQAIELEKCFDFVIDADSQQVTVEMKPGLEAVINTVYETLKAIVETLVPVLQKIAEELIEGTSKAVKGMYQELVKSGVINENNINEQVSLKNSTKKSSAYYCKKKEKKPKTVGLEKLVSFRDYVKFIREKENKKMPKKEIEKEENNINNLINKVDKLLTTFEIILNTPDQEKEERKVLEIRRSIIVESNNSSEKLDNYLLSGYEILDIHHHEGNANYKPHTIFVLAKYDK